MVPKKEPSGRAKNILTIGIYEGHAFYIQEIARLAKNYKCADCQYRFTRFDNL